MQINKVFEHDDGNLEFNGTLTGKELQFVVEVGLNLLLQQGAIPFVVDSDSELAPGSDELN